MTRAEFLVEKIDKALSCLDIGANEEARLHLLYAIGRIANADRPHSADVDGIKKVLFALEKERMGGGSAVSH